jgi:hypothetical protein
LEKECVVEKSNCKTIFRRLGNGKETQEEQRKTDQGREAQEKNKQVNLRV